jgi:hypothetical protein
MIDCCLLLQVGAMPHGNTDADYIDDFISGYYLNNFVFISKPIFAVLLMIDMSFAYGREQSLYDIPFTVLFQIHGSTCGYIAYCIWERFFLTYQTNYSF